MDRVVLASSFLNWDLFRTCQRLHSKSLFIIEGLHTFRSRLIADPQQVSKEEFLMEELNCFLEDKLFEPERINV